MSTIRILSIGAFAASSVLILAGCGESKSAAPAAAGGSQATAQTAGGSADATAKPGAAGDVTAGGEPASFRYADSVGHWLIYGPGSMTPNPHPEWSLQVKRWSRRGGTDRINGA